MGPKVQAQPISVKNDLNLNPNEAHPIKTQ